jgi:hypothetical protein
MDLKNFENSWWHFEKPRKKLYTISRHVFSWNSEQREYFHAIILAASLSNAK